MARKSKIDLAVADFLISAYEMTHDGQQNH